MTMLYRGGHHYSFADQQDHKKLNSEGLVLQFLHLLKQWHIWNEISHISQIIYKR